MRTKQKRTMTVETMRTYISGMPLDRALRIPGRYSNKAELMNVVHEVYAEELRRRKSLQTKVRSESKTLSGGLEAAAQRAGCQLFQLKAALYHGIPTDQGAKYLEAALVGITGSPGKSKTKTLENSTELDALRKRCQSIIDSGIDKSNLATAVGIGWKAFIGFVEKNEGLTDKSRAKVEAYLEEHNKADKETKSTPRQLSMAKARKHRKQVTIEEPAPRHDLLRDLITAARDPEMCQVLGVLAKARKSFNGRTEQAFNLLLRIEAEGLNADALLEAYA